ncbi:hypothetical protein TIFTF001_017086 [Ficus carica]|uniref:Uncharacterized protein n=1 Tax=Ficus carica TaxID=3494 RepID=A0AA88A8Y1_FICCA|nr:hypothetical protein TIFTF001_017086 [Ficus carica]
MPGPRPLPVREHRRGGSASTPRWSRPTSTSLTKCLVGDCSEIHRQSGQIALRETKTRVWGENNYPSRAVPAARQNPGPDNRTDEPEQEHILHTIFGGTATGDTASSRRSYAHEARWFARGEYINMAKHISKICRQDSTPITFTDDEVNRLLHPYNDALIGEIRVADNVIRRVLVDNGSSAGIMFMDAFSRLRIRGAVLTPAQTPLYGFAGECVRTAGTVRLLVTIGDGPERVTQMVEFIVVDRPSVYNVILGRPTLNALKAVVSTYHLAMKFPTGSGVGVFWGNQEGARKCYMEAVNKVCRKALAPITVAAIFTMDEIEDPCGEVKRLSDLDSRIPEEEIRAHPVEDLGLVSFPIERLDQPRIERKEQVLCSENATTWIDPIVRYLTESQLPENREEARRIKNTSARYTLINGKLYRRGHSALYQRCVPRPGIDRQEVSEQNPTSALTNKLLWFPDHGVRSHDWALTERRCPSRTPHLPLQTNSCGSRTTELGLMIGH